MPQTDQLTADARRFTRRLSSNAARAAVQGFGRNAESTYRTAEANYRRALAAVVHLEDRDGVDATTDLHDALITAARRAVDAGLFSTRWQADTDADVVASIPVPS